MFSDDTLLCLSDCYGIKIIETINNELLLVCKWIISNKLRLNVKSENVKSICNY